LVNYPLSLNIIYVMHTVLFIMDVSYGRYHNSNDKELSVRAIFCNDKRSLYKVTQQNIAPKSAESLDRR